MKPEHRILILAGAILLVACGEQPEITEPAGNDTRVPVSLEVSGIAPVEGDDTRGSTIGYPADITALRLFAPLWEKTEEGYIFRFYEIADETVERGSNGTWSTTRPYYWPGKTKALSFFAYSPVDTEGWEIATPPHTSPESMRFFYTPPSDPRRQHDIVFASDTGMLNYSDTPGRSVSLSFSHILANIRFRIEGDSTGVGSITLANVYGESGFWPGGDYWDRMNRDNTREAAKTSYTVEPAADGSIGEEWRLMIVPQQPTPPDAAIIVKTRDGQTFTSAFGYRSLLKGALTTVTVRLPGR